MLGCRTPAADAHKQVLAASSRQTICLQTRADASRGGISLTSVNRLYCLYVDVKLQNHIPQDPISGARYRLNPRAGERRVPLSCAAAAAAGDACSDLEAAAREPGAIPAASMTPAVVTCFTGVTAAAVFDCIGAALADSLVATACLSGVGFLPLAAAVAAAAGMAVAVGVAEAAAAAAAAAVFELLPTSSVTRVSCFAASGSRLRLRLVRVSTTGIAGQTTSPQQHIHKHSARLRHCSANSNRTDDACARGSGAQAAADVAPTAYVV